MNIATCFLCLCLISHAFAQKSHTEWIRSITVQIYEGELDCALTSLDSIIAVDSTQAALWYLKGQACARLGDNTKALQAFHHTVELDSSHINALAAAANLYEKAGYFNRAAYYFNQALNADSTRLDIGHQLGQLYFNHNDFINARETYADLSDKNKENATCLILLGKCEDKLENPTGALNYLKRALCIDSTNVSCLYNIGRLYIKLEEPDSALPFINMGLKRNFKHDGLHLLKANIFYGYENWEAALEEYQLYEAHSTESNPYVMKKQGFAYFRLQEFEKALIQFSRAVREDANDAVAHFYLGLCLKHLGRLEPAARVIESAIKLSLPESLNTYYAELGNCYHEIKDYKQAIQAFRRALLYEPTENNYLYALANVYYDYYKDRSVALRCYECVVAENDNPEIVNFAKARVVELKEEIHMIGN